MQIKNFFKIPKILKFILLSSFTVLIFLLIIYIIVYTGSLNSMIASIFVKLAGANLNASDTVIPQTHQPHLKFRIDSALLIDTTKQAIGLNLIGYVADVNAIFAKNTVRSFAFDTETDIEIVAPPLPGGGSCGPLPKNSYDVVIYITKSNYSISYGGKSGCGTQKNMLNTWGFRWSRFYSRYDIQQNFSIGYGWNSLDDYIGQIHILVHEIAHTHAVAIGEYYANYPNVLDSSGISPSVDLKPSSTYWQKRSLVTNDPMSSIPRSCYNNNNITIQCLNILKFTPLSAEIINRVARGQVPDACYNSSAPFTDKTCELLAPYNQPNSVKVIVRDVVSRAAIPNCLVSMYPLFKGSGGSRRTTSTATLTALTDQQGIAQLAYQKITPPLSLIHTQENSIRLFKADCPNYIPNGEWLTVFDLQAGLLMPQGGADGDFRYSGQLEILLTPKSPWQNPKNKYDVNNDGLVTTMDASIIINDLNKKGPRNLIKTNEPLPPPFIDVNGDKYLTPSDALFIINCLNNNDGKNCQ